MTKEEGNKAIGEFMGWTFIDDETVTHPDHSDHGRLLELRKDILQYHSSWDWLMPCLKKAKQAIKEAGWGTTTEKEANRRLGAALNETYNLNIENAHFCLVKFIEWYNKAIKSDE